MEEQSDVKSVPVRVLSITMIAAIIIMVWIQFAFPLVIVSGSSMRPTYTNGELLISTRSFKVSNLNRNDVIVFSSVLAGAISGMTVANIVEKSTGVPCITGFLAMIRAIRALGIQRPVAISPFPDELDLIFKRKLQQNGIDLEASYRLATEGENGEVSIRALTERPEIRLSLRAAGRAHHGI